MIKKCIRLTLPLLVLICFILITSGCSNNSNSQENKVAGNVLVPKYSTNEIVASTYAADLSDTTDSVKFWQDKGEELAQFIENSGLIQIDDGVFVQLTEMYKNDCPETVCSSEDLTDAEILGIGENALITSFPSTSSIRNQSERGTCVAFALNAAMEVMEQRYGKSTPNLSEQNSYFMAKKLTGTWGEAGLVSETAIECMTWDGIPFVSESRWPYNPYQEDCDDYLESYPDYYCSETEAQGGGYNDHEQDPHAASSAGITIREAHKLYASVDRVRQALYRGYPVILSFNANSDFRVATQKNGVVSWVFKVPGCPSGICGHAVLAIGYQDDQDIEGGGYIIIKNSWGTDWGDSGYAYLTYAWLVNSILDAQAVATIQ